MADTDPRTKIPQIAGLVGWSAEIDGKLIMDDYALVHVAIRVPGRRPVIVHIQQTVAIPKDNSKVIDTVGEQ